MIEDSLSPTSVRHLITGFGRSHRPHQSSRAIALAGAGLAWTAAMTAASLGAAGAHVSSRMLDVLLIAPPVALALFWALSHRPAPTLLRVATGWSAILAVILLLTPQAVGDPSLVAGIPAVIALTWVVYRWPAIGAVVVIGITASFGSLSAYLSFPYKRALTLLFLALWLAAVARLVITRRREGMSFPFGVLMAAAYVVISAVQVVLADNPHVALGGWELAPLYMTTLFVVAFSQLSTDTHLRIVRWLMVAALLVGAYSTLRLIIGPSSLEKAMASRSLYNFVNGKQKDIGSFVSGPDLAEWTALMIPFCLSCALGMRGRTRLLAWLALPLLAIGLFGSQVRAPAFAVGIAALVVAVLHSRPRAFPGARFGVAAIAVAAVAAIGIAAYSLGGGSAKGHSYVALLTGDTNDVSVSTHEYKWGIALHDLTGHPFGYGLGTAPAGYTSNAPPTTYILPVTGFSVDNGFLKIALEQGFTVMTVFALALVLLAAGLARGGLVLRDPRRATIALGAAGTAVSFFVLEGAGAFADGVPAIAGWLVIGLGLAQLVLRKPAADGAD